jgi:GT2 family glycosyltransferase
LVLVDESTGTRPADPEVAIIVLNWNGWRDTIACLESLVQLDQSGHRVIVVDNGSDDGSAERIRESSPGITTGAIVLETGTNLGFAGGCNVGIRHALAHGASFVWLLNNDTIAGPDSLGAMVDEMRRRDEVGIVGSIVRPLHRPDAVEAWGGGRINRFLGTTRRNVSPRQRLDYVAGTSVLIRREVFDDAGLLDEDFFFYLEDVDFCRRAAARGWKLAVADRAEVLHKGGATVNEGRAIRSEHADRLHVRSSGVFVGKHAGSWVVPSAAVRLGGIAARRLGRRQVRRLPELCREFMRGAATGRRARA